MPATHTPNDHRPSTPVSLLASETRPPGGSIDAETEGVGVSSGGAVTAADSNDRDALVSGGPCRLPSLSSPHLHDRSRPQPHHPHEGRGDEDRHLAPCA